MKRFPFIVAAFVACAVVARANDIHWHSLSVPGSATGGTALQSTAVIQNTGSEPWGGNHYLAMKDAGGNVVALESIDGVEPGQIVTRTITLGLPDVTQTMPFTFQALEHDYEFFGATHGRTVSVTAAPPYAGMQLSATTFSAATPPNISTTDGILSAPHYRLRAKVIDGTQWGWHMANEWNKNNYPVDSPAPAGNYATCALYWVRYSGLWGNVLEIGPERRVPLLVSDTVKLSAYSFHSASPPTISTAENLGSAYRLHATLANSQGGVWETAGSLNNNGWRLTALPPPGNYEASLYWRRYDGAMNLVETSPPIRRNVAISSGPIAVLDKEGQLTPEYYIDDDGNRVDFVSEDSHWFDVTDAGTVTLYISSVGGAVGTLFNESGQELAAASTSPTAQVTPGRYVVFVGGSAGNYQIAGSLTLDAVPITLTGSNVAAGQFGAAFDGYRVTANGSTPMTFGASNLPPGLNINTSTGYITGVPAAAGTFSAWLTAANITGSSGKTVAFSIGRAVPTLTVAGELRVNSFAQFEITSSRFPTTAVGLGGNLPPPAGPVTYAGTILSIEPGVQPSPVAIPAGLPVFPNAIGMLNVTATYAGDANYLPATKQVSFGVLDTLPPEEPSPLQFVRSAATSTGATVSWTPFSDHTGAAFGRPQFGVSYEVSLDNGPWRAVGSSPIASFNGLSPGSAHQIRVRAKDIFGNPVEAVTSGSFSVPSFDPPPAGQASWAQVDGDGLLDELIPFTAGGDSFNITELQSYPEWMTESAWIQSFITLPGSWDYLAVPTGRFTSTDQPQVYYVPIYVPGEVFPAWSTETETIEVEMTLPALEYVAEGGVRYAIVREHFGSDNILRRVRLSDGDFHHGELGDPLSSQIWMPATYWATAAIYAFPLKLVRYGAPIGKTILTLPVVGATAIGIRTTGSGPTTGPIDIGGVIVDVGANSGSITFPGGGTISANNGVVSVANIPGVPNGPVTGTISLGSLGTVQVDTAGNATLSVGSAVPLLGGAVISANAGGGGGIVLPSGVEVSVSGTGRLGITLPPGTDPTIVRVMDVANRVLSVGAGASISVRDILGNVIPLPTSGVLGSIDAAITGQGRFEVGVRSNTDAWFWFDVFTLPKPRLAVDANRDGQIVLGAGDATSVAAPYRFWLNDDNDDYTTGPNYADGVVNGWNDLKKDFFPVFLDIKQLLNALPPSSGATYKLKQADGALNFVYTDLTRATAFRFKDGYTTELFTAPTTQITAAGVALSTTFLNSVKDGDQGVLLMEGRAVTNQPLLLVVEKDGAVVAQTSLYVSIAPNILLLLHGMNSNTDTWDAFVGSSQTFYVGGSGIIGDGAIQSTPSINYNGVRCYRLQFGAFDMASTRTGVEGVTAANTPGYDTVGTRCGDFETFDQLGQEVEDAITLLLARHPGARIILAGHSRGGLSGRAFLERPGSSAAKAAVIGMLTTSSPNLGSRMGRIYGWLNTHPRGTPQAYSADWDAVDFLIQPTVLGQPKPPLDVRRPVILDVADNSLAIANLNAQTAVQNLPATVRYGEIQYAAARFGQLSITPVRYSVLESTGIGNLPQFKQLSSEATDFLLAGGSPGDVQFIGDGLIPRANQRFTQLTGFSGIAVAPLVVTDREVVHTGAPSQIADLLAQLKQLAPELFP